MLIRKIDKKLIDWKKDPCHLPLIIKGARQVGKTTSIRHFAKTYKRFIEINFVHESEYKNIFDDGFNVDSIIKKISIINQKAKIEPHNTLIFFDELQACPNCATSLKFFCEDKRYDVICSGSLMGINYNEIESNSVGYKEDVVMHSLDFEEYLWAIGFQHSQLEDLYQHMLKLTPLSSVEMNIFGEHFRDYMLLGGMPAVVESFVKTKTFQKSFQIQKQLLVDYEEDITKYAIGLDKGKIKNIYRNISVFLAKENKKFQISKVAKNARSRDYIGTVDWLNDAGIINICYNLDIPELPLKGNYNEKEYKLYFRDSGLLIASLEEEAQEDLRKRQNFNTYKGALFENIVADTMVKQGYDNLFYYRNDKSTVEIDFVIRDANSAIPVEVKANDNATVSLNNLIKQDKYPDIKYGIKLCNKNIGFNGLFFTFPYFLTMFLKRFLREKDELPSVNHS